MADLFFAPFYERMLALQDAYDCYRLPDADTLPRVRAHVEASMAHPSYLATQLDPDWLRALYRPFAHAEDWVGPNANRAVRDIVD